MTYAARLSFLVHLTTRWTPPPWPRGVAAPPKAGNRSSFVRAAWRALSGLYRALGVPLALVIFAQALRSHRIAAWAARRIAALTARSQWQASVDTAFANRLERLLATQRAPASS